MIQVVKLLALYLKVNANECDLYLAPSNMNGVERGIIAGRTFPAGYTVEVSPSVIVKMDEIRRKQLSNYVYGSEDKTYSIVTFGSGMLFNHRNPKSIQHYYHDYPILSPTMYLGDVYSAPYSSFSFLDFVTEKAITFGEELFASYGDDSWFSSRNITFVAADETESFQYSTETLREYGHCLSDVYTNQSTIPLAGNGLFARRRFEKGELVHVSPTIVLSRFAIERTQDSSLLLNYCITDTGSDVALLPIGLGSIINHGGKMSSNTHLEWYTWKQPPNSPVNPIDRLNWDAKDLEAYPAAPLDIAFVADRDISAGEEIFWDYGGTWEETWDDYLQAFQASGYTQKGAGVFNIPQFRQAMASPEGFFPKHFFDHGCINKGGCSTKLSRKRSSTLQRSITRALKQAVEY
jgi:hypothetical protein